MALWEIAALIGVGFVGSVINAFAAGGSFLTLPLLIFLGLPAGVANGTNRVGVLAQGLGAVVGFHRHQVLPLGWSLQASVPAMAGAGLGVWAALLVPDVAFKRILSLVMLAVALVSIVHRASKGTARDQPRSPWHWSVVVGFFILGIYGGFLQAGIGFMILALTSTTGFDLVRGNAIKVFSVTLITVLSLAVFAGAGQVHWPAGAALAVGSVAGGLVGVRLAVLKGQRWLERAVTVALIVVALLLMVSE